MATRVTKIQPQVLATGDETFSVTSLQPQVLASGGETFRATALVVQVLIAVPPAAPNFDVPGFLGM